MSTYPKTRDILYPLILVNLLFFMWGFIWNMANVLVILFQENFELNNFETSLITAIGFLAFFTMSYPAKIVISRLKTQNSIVLGAVIAALGLLIYIPAALFMNYILFLAGTFVMFSGVTILQVICNPYIRALGPPDRSASRINLSQGLGAIGAWLTSYIGGWFILRIFKADPFNGIVWFYLILGVIFIILAAMVKIAKMPANPSDDGQDYENNAHQDEKTKKTVWSFRHFRIGFIVLLLYMGAEAILYQLMTPYFKEQVDISNDKIVFLSGILFFGLMVGRLLGAGILIKVNPGRLVGIFAGVSALLIITSMISSGYIAIYSIVATGFFISIMFATIYSLAIDGLGKFTIEASSFLIMAISGGFFIPLLFGLVADFFDLKTSLIIVIIPLLLASWYGFFGAKKNKET